VSRHQHEPSRVKHREIQKIAVSNLDERNLIFGNTYPVHENRPAARYDVYRELLDRSRRKVPWIPRKGHCDDENIDPTSPT
jgi:hypothetical protein